MEMQSGVSFRTYNKVLKKWIPDHCDKNRKRRMVHAMKGIQIVLMDKDLAKYM